MEHKANEKYSDLARWGLAHRCAQALVALKKKQSASGFECLAVLHQTVDLELEEYTAVMMDRLLGADTPDRVFFKSWAGV